MRLSKFAAALATCAAVGFSGAAMSASITNTDGVLQPFSGFDWAAGGAAWTLGLTAAETAFAGGCALPGSCDFTINYAAWAVGLTKPGGAGLPAPSLDSNPNGVDGGYEYTIKASLTATLVVFDPFVSGIARYVIGGGTFDIFYDTAANADIGASPGPNPWTGFGNGVNIISGTLFTVNSQVLDLVTGAGQVNLVGTVTGQNGAFVSPEIVGTTVVSTLQLFPSTQITDFTRPVSVDGVALPLVGPDDDEALFQADANQNFDFRTPEPASMLLTGLALAGLGFASRRRERRAS